MRVFKAEQQAFESQFDFSHFSKHNKWNEVQRTKIISEMQPYARHTEFSFDAIKHISIQ